MHGNIYGTSVAAVREVAANGKCCILDIDVQGARQVRGPLRWVPQHYPWDPQRYLIAADAGAS